MISYSKQSISKQDQNAVKKVLKSDFLTQGPKVPKFESEIKKITKSKYAIAVNSATSALHIACMALNLKKNDWLWTSANSFVASSNCALYCGAKVDLLDINLDDYNIDIDKLKTKLERTKKNKRPKILVVVHFGGKPCDMEEIYKLSVKYNFKIIEDASHALGSKFKKRNIGDCFYSDISVFSFHPVKNITTGEGGILTTNNKKISEISKVLRTHGINKDKKKFQFKNNSPWYFEQILLGYNYRMNDIEAALGISQLKRLKFFLKKRNQISKIYTENLKSLNLFLPKQNKNCYNSYHLYPIRIKDNKTIKFRKSLYDFLKEKKIFLNLHYIPIYRHPYYKKKGFKKENFPNCEKYYNSALSLPIYPDLKQKNLFKIIRYIKIFLDKQLRTN